MKVHLASLGCKLNQAEMDDLARALGARGWRLAAPQDADVIVLNSCAVTAEAERKSRQAIHRLRSLYPAARLVVTGCLADLWPETARRTGADLVVDNDAKPHLDALLASWTGLEPGGARTARRRTRAFVRIQDGCDNACAYCIVRVARGPSRSRSPEDVLADVAARVAEGHLEVVLTGVNIGAYGVERVGPDLGDLTRAILAETGIRRLRWSSVEPWDMKPAWLGLFSNSRLCPHLHLPLQSGSDRILERMGRRYTSAAFLDLTRAAYAAIADLAITTDIIAGFPGETEADHVATMRLMKEAGFARAHVFPFSPRPNTAAADMPDPVPPAEARTRAAALRGLSRELERHFQRRLVGKTVEVLWEVQRGETFSGLTTNYVRVETRCGRNLANTITPTRIEGLTAHGMEGTVVDAD